MRFLKKKEVLSTFCIMILISLCSCSTQTGSAPTPDTPKIDGLIKIQKENIEINQGASASNTLIVRNAYETSQEFHLKVQCNHACFSKLQENAEIDANKQESFRFTIGADAEPGIYKETITVTDINNNFYASQDLIIQIK